MEYPGGTCVTLPITPYERVAVRWSGLAWVIEHSPYLEELFLVRNEIGDNPLQFIDAPYCDQSVTDSSRVQSDGTAFSD